MKFFKINKMLYLVIITSFAFLVGGCNWQKSYESKDIVDTAIEAGSFNTLVAALEAADLANVLRGEGPFTVFAPLDSAFARLPENTLADLLKPENKEKLQDILTYHVIAGEHDAGAVTRMGTAKTVNGLKISVRKAYGTFLVDKATVVKSNIMAKNGVIHVVDRVIIPRDI